eukprot:4270757-Karenia_brevis.AAC.1
MCIRDRSSSIISSHHCESQPTPGVIISHCQIACSGPLGSNIFGSARLIELCIFPPSVIIISGGGGDGGGGGWLGDRGGGAAGAGAGPGAEAESGDGAGAGADGGVGAGAYA